jgi:elongation factor P
VLKPAKIATGFEIGVPIFVAQGDKVEVDTRTLRWRAFFGGLWVGGL